MTGKELMRAVCSPFRTNICSTYWVVLNYTPRDFSDTTET